MSSLMLRVGLKFMPFDREGIGRAAEHIHPPHERHAGCKFGPGYRIFPPAVELREGPELRLLEWFDGNGPCG